MSRSTRSPRVATITVLAVLGLGLIALTLGTWRWIAHDREALTAEFSRQRLQALRQVAHDVERDHEAVVDDLRFAGRLALAAPADSDLRWLLRAVLGTIRPYHTLTLADAHGRPRVQASDPLMPAGFPPALDRALAATTRAALADRTGHAHTSPPIAFAGSWYRVVASRLGEASPASPFVVASLVLDARFLLEKLRLSAADAQTALLLLGPSGEAAPVTSASLARALRRGRSPGSGLGRLVERMRRGAAGTVRLGGSEAHRLGLGSADLVAAHVPLHLQDDAPWSVATLTSLAVLRRQERSILWRMGLASAAVALLLVGLGLFALLAARRQAVTQERLRHAVEVAQLDERSDKVLESIPTGVLALAEDGRVTRLNRALREKLPAARPGMSLAEVLAGAPPDHAAQVGDLAAQAREHRRPLSVVGEPLALFGREGRIRVQAVPLDPPSPSVATLLVFDDLTEMKALEDQLVRQEKLATIGTLAAGIAHEIGTPLSVVRGRAEYVLGKLPADEVVGPSLRIVIEQADQVVRTLRELLDYSRARPGAIGVVPIEPVVTRVLELLRFEVEHRRIAVEPRIAPGLPAVRANPDQLQQVLVNLLLNAFDAVPGPGRVEISARLEDPPPAGGAGPHVLLEVSDTGPGIPPEHLHRVFDPFFTTKKRGQGTGLGLYIVAQIAHQHGAEIAIESRPGEGARVRLRWPVVGPRTVPHDEA